MRGLLCGALVLSLFLACGAIEPLLLDRYLFRVLYTVGRASRLDSDSVFAAKQGWVKKDGREPTYSYIEVDASNLKEFVRQVIELYPRPCKSIKYAYKHWINTVGNFRTPDGITDDAGARRWVSAALWAASCSDHVVFPHNYEHVLPANMSSVIKNDGSELFYDDKTSCDSSSLCNVTSMQQMISQLYPCSEGVGEAFWGLMHSLSQSVPVKKFFVWRKMISHFVKGVFPCSHCRDSFHHMWQKGSPKGEGPLAMAVQPLWDFLPLPANPDDARMWMWKLHNIISMRIAARHANEHDANALHNALYLGKKVWPPLKRTVCTTSESGTGSAALELPSLQCIMHVGAYRKQVSTALDDRWSVRDMGQQLLRPVPVPVNIPVPKPVPIPTPVWCIVKNIHCNKTCGELTCSLEPGQNERTCEKDAVNSLSMEQKAALALTLDGAIANASARTDAAAKASAAAGSTGAAVGGSASAIAAGGGGGTGPGPSGWTAPPSTRETVLVLLVCVLSILLLSSKRESAAAHDYTAIGQSQNDSHYAARLDSEISESDFDAKPNRVARPSRSRRSRRRESHPDEI